MSISPLLRGALLPALMAGVAMAQESKPAPAPTETPAPTAPATPAPTPAPATTDASAPAPAAAAAPESAAPKPATEAFARLVCYREKRFAGSVLHHTIAMDGKDVADLNNGTYFVIKATPGEHKLHGDEAKEEITFKVEAGKTYYFRTELVMGLFKGHGKINAVEEATGVKEMTEWKAKLKYTPEIRNPEIVEKPTEEPAAK